MASCSYSELVGGLCGPSVSNPANTQCVLIGKCEKDVRGHLNSIKVRDTSLDEARLLLARAGCFDVGEVDLKNSTICPRHRDLWGIRWRSNKRNCSCPIQWTLHEKNQKGDRGISSAQSRRLHLQAQILLPVGSPICKQCRTRLGDQEEQDEVVFAVPVSENEAQEVEDSTQHTGTTSSRAENIALEDEELSQSMAQLCVEECSVYIPETESSSSSGELSDTGCQTTTDVQRKKLNEFLSACNYGSISAYRKNWQEASVRTRKSRVGKAKESVVAALNVIAPGDAGYLWEALKVSQSVEKELGVTVESTHDMKYLEALAETYNNASSWSTRRQILSVMADITTLDRIQAYLPSVTEFKFTMARKHKIQYGRGVPLPLQKSPRMRVDTDQLDHFLTFITSPHVIQDLPFGQRYLHLSSGKVLETPNVIRTMIPQRIVNQYVQYCKETDFKPFGTSTMLRILSCCSATVRKSLQGLDYIAAEGAKGFDDLHRILDRLGEYGLERDMVSHYQNSLKEAKQYLKSDYKVHIAESANIADHCSTYALSDSKEDLFRGTCNHSHDEYCMQCETLKEVLEKIQNCFVNCTISQEERDDLTYSYRQAVESIKAWKSHQLRCSRQDEARTNVLDNLDQNSVHITQDWAMKFLPQKYRESQSDWFGKRGISWHITVVARKVQEHFQHQSFIHIVENSKQDSMTVVRIIEHTLRTLKNEHPELTTAFLRQDNAGCYHSAEMLGSCAHMKLSTGIEVQRVDFSDPQGGKGPCDRKAATVKAHVRRYINEGHDVLNATDLKNAMLSNGGIRDVRVVLVDASSSERPVTQVPMKWVGISSLNNFLYSDNTITVWRAYNIGSGKQIAVPDYSHPPSFESAFSPGDFSAVSPDVHQQKSKTRQPKEHLSEQVASDQETNALFSCPNISCIKSYQRHSALENHLLYGKCEFLPVRETLMDQAKVLYHEKLCSEASALPSVEGISQRHPSISTEVLTQGWALRSVRKATRFSEAQRQYLESKFKVGQETGMKIDPANVAHDMRYARNQLGEKLFTVDEFLTAQQIQSYFSRKASKLRHAHSDDDEQAEQDADIMAAEDEVAHASFRSVVLQEVALRHPIIFDTFNLCEMHGSGKLRQLSISVLRSICDYYHIDVANIKGRRKAPYLSLLGELLETCDCYHRRPVN